MRINRTFLALCRTIHIYLTMLGLFVMLMFGITGFTISHEDWFGATRPHATDEMGQTARGLIDTDNFLRIVENARQLFHITGAMTGFDDLGDHFSVGFKAPGQSWDVEIEKSTGNTTSHHEAFGVVAVLNDLHRGRDAGSGWRWIIDISALLLVLASVTGLVLWMALPKRRKLGLAAMFIGVVATVAVFVWQVPGSDASIPLTAPISQTQPADISAK